MPKSNRPRQLTVETSGWGAPSGAPLPSTVDRIEQSYADHLGFDNPAPEPEPDYPDPQPPVQEAQHVPNHESTQLPDQVDLSSGMALLSGTVIELTPEEATAIRTIVATAGVRLFEAGLSKWKEAHGLVQQEK